MNFTSTLLTLLQSILAFFFGILVLGLVIFPAGIVIESAFPGSLGPDNFPVTVTSQILLLVIEFIGGAVATMVVILAAPRALAVHAILFGALILGLNILTITAAGSGWPLWASAVLLIAVLPQIWMGLKLGRYIRKPVSSDQ